MALITRNPSASLRKLSTEKLREQLDDAAAEFGPLVETHKTRAIAGPAGVLGGDVRGYLVSAEERASRLEKMEMAVRSIEEELTRRRELEMRFDSVTGERLDTLLSSRVHRELVEARSDLHAEKQKIEVAQSQRDAMAEMAVRNDAMRDSLRPAPKPVEWLGFKEQIMIVLASALVVRWIRGIPSDDEIYLDDRGNEIQLGNSNLLPRPLLDVNDVAVLHSLLIGFCERGEANSDQFQMNVNERRFWPGGTAYLEATLANLTRLGFIRMTKHGGGEVTFRTGPLTLELVDQHNGQAVQRKEPRQVWTAERTERERVTADQLDPALVQSIESRGWSVAKS